MIDHTHELAVKRQAELVGISRASVSTCPSPWAKRRDPGAIWGLVLRRGTQSAIRKCLKKRVAGGVTLGVSAAKAPWCLDGGQRPDFQCPRRAGRQGADAAHRDGKRVPRPARSPAMPRWSSSPAWTGELSLMPTRTGRCGRTDLARLRRWLDHDRLVRLHGELSRLLGRRWPKPEFAK